MEYYTKKEVDDIMIKVRQEAVEESLKVLPAVIQNLIASIGTIHEVSSKFYQDNPELVNHKKLVASIIQEVEADNPGSPFKEIADKAGLLTKERLKLNLNLSTDSADRPSDNKINEGLQNVMEAFDEGIREID